MRRSRTFGVALASSDPSHAVDEFFKYEGEHLPKVGDLIEVVRFVRGRAIRARVTSVDPYLRPPIKASQVGLNRAHSGDP